MRPLHIAVAVLLLSGCAAVGQWQVDTLHSRAEAAYERGDHARAVTGYRAYLDIAPRDPQAWFRLGNAQAQLGHLRQAEASYYRTLALDPDRAQARHNLGLVHMQLAWKALLEAREDLPEVDEASGATMRYLGCLMQTFMGHPQPPLCGDDMPPKETP